MVGTANLQCFDLIQPKTKETDGRRDILVVVVVLVEVVMDVMICTMNRDVSYDTSHAQMSLEA